MFLPSFGAVGWARLNEHEVGVVDRLLESGAVVPPPEDGEDRAPRAAG